jgi:hypothetical protein
MARLFVDTNTGMITNNTRPMVIRFLILGLDVLVASNVRIRLPIINAIFVRKSVSIIPR